MKGGWYHVSARGIERRRIFFDNSYYRHFLELLEAMSGRYCVEVHAHCLMPNHYHLIIRTPEANASQAIQWLNVSYSAWFNFRQERIGHVFQGRFNSVLIDNNGAWLLLASEYLHLNPVRTKAMGLGKHDVRVEGYGYRVPADEEVVKRIEKLRKFKWSSYPAYAGFAGKPKWLHTDVILERIGGREKYRNAVQAHLTCGADPKRFECLRGRVVLGTAEFVERAKKLVVKVSGEQPDRRFVKSFVSFERIVEVVEKETGLRWAKIGHLRGNEIRNLVLYLARQRSGMTLREIGQKAGGLDYKLVCKVAQGCDELIRKDNQMRALAKKCLNELAKSET